MLLQNKLRKLTDNFMCIIFGNIMYKIVYGDIVAGLRDKMSSIILFVLNCDVIGARDLFFLNIHFFCGDLIGRGQWDPHSEAGPPKPFYY